MLPGGTDIHIQQQTSMQSGRRRVVYMIFAAGLFFLAFAFVNNGWGPIITPLSTRLHISLAAAGLLYVAWSTGYPPGALIGGALLDRYGLRLVLFVAALIILTGLTTICLSLRLHVAPQLVLLIGAGVAGIGGGTIDAASNGLIISMFAQRRGMALNLVQVLYLLAGVVIALIDAGLLTLFHNDPLPLFLFTICFTLVAMLALPAVPRKYLVEVKVAHQHEDAPRQSTMSLLAALVPVIVAVACISGIYASVQTWTPAYLHVAYGQTPASAAALSSLILALSTLGSLGAALLIVRIGSWRLILLAVGMTLCGLVALLLSPTTLVATMTIALASMGLSPTFSTFLTIGSERVDKSPGAVAGILLFTTRISTIFCSWLFGFLLSTGKPAWAVIFCLVLVCSGGLVALRLRPR